MRIRERFAHNDIISLTGEAVRYDLAESVGPDLALGALLDKGGIESLRKLPLGYGSTAGAPELRRLIAARQGIAAENVVVMTGSMQALFLVAFILCEPGCDAVVGSPVFPNTETALAAVGARVRHLRLDFADGYRLDVGRLQAALTPATRLVCLASPQNPSGVALTRDELTDVLCCMDRICPDAALLIDETYREAAYGDERVEPSFAALHPRIVTCASLSKCHGAPGLRIGWATTSNRALRDQLVLGKFNTIICSSAIDEALAIRVLKSGREIEAPRRALLQAGLGRVAQLVSSHRGHLEWVRPDAGALCCLRLSPRTFDAAAVERFYAALRAKDVRVGNGTWFGEDPRVFRLGFGHLPLADLDEALARLGAALVEAGRRAA